jgi:hypothetical protein
MGETIVTPICAVRLRIRRVTTEHAYVDVPLSALPERGGKPDFSVLGAAAIEIARTSKLEWYPDEEPDIHPHPIQGPAGPQTRSQT